MRPIAKGEVGGTVSYIKVPTLTESPSMYSEALTSLGCKYDYKDIYDDNEVMSKLLCRNKLNLNQAWNTPCTTGLLREYIGEYGLRAGAKDIIDGNFDPNKSKNLPIVNYWLKHNIRRVAPTESIDVNITLENFKSLMKAQDKSTSLSPSGRHYGQYKAVRDKDNLCLVSLLAAGRKAFIACWKKILEIQK
eukprot:1162676-Ditylum_brightwellii.AAC.1